MKYSVKNIRNVINKVLITKEVFMKMINFTKEEVIELLQKYFLNEGESVEITCRENHTQFDSSYELIATIKNNIEILGINKETTETIKSTELEEILLKIFSNTQLNIDSISFKTNNKFSNNKYISEFNGLTIFIKNPKEKVKK